MKNFTSLEKCLFCMLICLSALSNAQTVSTDYANTVNSIFAGVDLNRVPHHLLTDYAMELVDLKGYNGVVTDSNYVQKGTYTAIYNTLLMARTNTDVTSLVHPNTYEDNWQDARDAYTISISGLYYKYSRLRESANPQDITVSNNKYYDKYVNGVWQDPYEQDQVFAVSAPIVNYKYKNMRVRLPANLWYTNQSSQVQSLTVDFNDGNGYQTITYGQDMIVSYPEAGIYDWDYRLTLTNGQQLYSHSKIIVGDRIAPLSSYDPINDNFEKRAITQACNPANLDSLAFDQIEFQGTQLFQGRANTATIQIRYASGACCDDITRPLIVAEGYESGLLGGENPLGDNDLDAFLDEARRPSFNLRAQINQYDIIYINWDQGRDDLRRNALLLEDIITWVNNTKTTDIQNVVLGQSMGGVIARFALADMEQKPNLDHDTKLYVSHDAPHQGANIPLGIQYMARHLSDQFVRTPLGDYEFDTGAGGAASIRQIRDLFNAQGTQQLLGNYINSSFQLDNSTGDAWRDELRLKGYPQQTRNIAISNGSHCALGQDFAANSSIFSMKGKIRTGVLTDILGAALGIQDDISLAIIFNEPALLLGILPGSSKFNIDFNAKALPELNQSANIYRGVFSYTKRFLWLVPITVNLSNRSYNNPISLPIDTYPGGQYEFLNDLDGINFFDDGDGEDDLSQFEADLLNALLANGNIDFVANPTFNFIPTPSALDAGGGSIALNDGDYRFKYNADNPPNGSKPIPFDNFTTSYDVSGANEQHISFNTRNGDWLALELDNVADNEDNFDCTFACNISNAEIQGPDMICNTANYSLPIGADNYIWTSSNLTNVQLEPNGNQVTLTRLNNYDGLISLQVRVISQECSIDQTFVREVYLGAPVLDRMVEVDPALTGHFTDNINTVCDNIGLRADFLPNNNGILNIEWRRVPTSEWRWTANQQGNRNTHVILEPSCNRTVQFEIRAQNQCGWSQWQTVEQELTTCSQSCNQSTGGFQSINDGYARVFPVPATIHLNIQLMAYPNGSLLVNPLEIRLYQVNTNRLFARYWSEQSSNTQINVSSLLRGQYVLELQHEGRTTSYNILLQD